MKTDVIGSAEAETLSNLNLCSVFQRHVTLVLLFFNLPASIVIHTQKYAGCNLILYIRAQIRAVSVQDYPANSCNAASPELISLWMRAQQGELHTDARSPNYPISFSSSSLIKLGMQTTLPTRISLIKAHGVFITGVQLW